MIRKAFILIVSIFLSACNNQENKSSFEKAGLKNIASPTDSVSAEPYLFTDKNGIVYLSWIEEKQDSSYLKFSSLSEDKWSGPSIIASGNNWFVNWADYPMLASDGEDNMMAHVLEKSETGTYTYDIKLFSSVNKGKSWTSAGILHNDGKKAEHGFVSLVPNNENYFISWLDGRNTGDAGSGHGHHGEMTIRAAVLSKGGIKTSEWELDNRVCDCCQTSATFTTNGPVVVYRDRTENEVRDINIVRQVNGKWTSPKPIFSDNWEISGCPVNGPRADSQGNNLAIAWFSAPEKVGKVQVIFSIDGGATFMAPIKINEANTIGRVDLVMLDENSAMVSWMEGSEIKAVRVHSDGKKDSSIVIASSSESRSGGFPQMTRSGNSVIFAWSDTKEKNIKTASLQLN